MKKRRSFFYADFWCKQCDVYCSDKTKYMKHLMTANTKKSEENQVYFTPKFTIVLTVIFNVKKNLTGIVI